MDLVPFGKYKDKPVEHLLADRSYTDWLSAQDWFREKFSSLYQLIQGEIPIDKVNATPEHNAMQAWFLDSSVALAVGLHVAPEAAHLTEDAFELLEWKERAVRDLFALGMSGPEFVHAVLDARVSDICFEDHGWDVSFVLDGKRAAVRRLGEWECNAEQCHQGQYPKHWSNEDCQFKITKPIWQEGARIFGYSKYDSELKGREVEKYFSSYVRAYVYVECKPRLGDDYPSVLRQVQRYRSHMMGNLTGRRNYSVVVVREYGFEGVTWNDVVRIFAASHIHLIYLPDRPFISE